MQLHLRLCRPLCSLKVDRFEPDLCVLEIRLGNKGLELEEEVGGLI